MTHAEKEKEAPGMMLYLSCRPMLEAMDGAKVKRLLLDMMNYIETGAVPEYRQKTLSIAWAAMQDKLDRDLKRYRNKCLQSKYVRFLREAMRKMPKEGCPDYEDWYRMSEEGTLTAAQVMDKYYYDG